MKPNILNFLMAGLFLSIIGCNSEPEYFGKSVDGWDGLEWGNSIEEVERDLEMIHREITPVVEYNKLFCPLTTDGFLIGGVTFNVHFQFGEESQRLEQILARHSLHAKQDAEPIEIERMIADFKIVLNECVDLYGLDYVTTTKEYAVESVMNESRRWELDSGYIEISIYISDLHNWFTLSFFPKNGLNRRVA